MSTSIRRYISAREEREYAKGYSDQDLEASALRKQFFKRHIVDFDTNLYDTQVERDWAYIARREYVYDVQLASVGLGYFVGNIAWSARMWMLKRWVIWPLPVVGILGAMVAHPKLFQKHNKKLFDMCNVGEEYFLGRARNEVLRECNRILDREDF
eukprot:TRINITY_DN226_c0_g1_i1.p3 TRINITY_DN226_c0_g1~~TRINITY_DN226_c0_g1_i1.p3  ORF type:complete len:155 (-),score=28.62 TRINITY_DN226_c0_g1_i1:140-604(-)